jgi:prepilin-type N-terminal cleavage/methylation domain-containing protein
MNHSLTINHQQIKNKGFTLIELLLVVAIIGVLATVVFASLNSARTKAKNAATIQSVKQIQTALTIYFYDNGRYPLNTPTLGGAVCFGDYGPGDTCNLSITTGGVPYGTTSVQNMVRDYIGGTPKHSSVSMGSASQDAFYYNCFGGPCTGYLLTFILSGSDQNCTAVKGLNYSDGSQTLLATTQTYTSTFNNVTYCLAVVNNEEPTSYN